MVSLGLRDLSSRLTAAMNAATRRFMVREGEDSLRDIDRSFSEEGW